MKQNLLLLAIVLLGNHIYAQPFKIGHTTVTLIDSSRNNRSIATEIYYPADKAGNNVAVAASTNAKFPILSFGHGFVITWDAYQNIWEAAVPEGYIIVFPKTEGGIAPSHVNMGKDLEFVLTALNNLSQDKASLFYNRIDSMNCVMGHSMGGGAAFLAAQNSTIIKYLAVFSPAETNPSAIQASAGLKIPSLILAGGNDCVAPPKSNQLPMFDSLHSSCKTYISINGGSHCQMAENNALCSFGEATCMPQPTISRSQQHVVINRYLIPWLNYQLKKNCVSGAQFDSIISSDASIIFKKNCLLCKTNTVIEYLKPSSFDVFPNPTSGQITIQSSKKLFNATIKLYNITGQIFTQKANLSGDNFTVDLSEFAKGVYVLEISGAEGLERVKVVKE